MSRPTEWLSKWIYNLAAGMYFTAVTLRTWLFYLGEPYLGRALGLLLLWLLMLICEPVISRGRRVYFPIYLILQTILVFLLMALPETPDFMGALLAVLSMQVMLRLPTRVGALWIGVCALIMMLLLSREYQYEAIPLALVFTAGNIFLGSYTRTIRIAQTADRKNQALAGELAQTNQKLQDTSAQLEQLAVARERNRLARELHDSVTQTVFSMSLTSQSAALLFERDRQQVGAQLERLYALSRSALAEMQLLIDELKPAAPKPKGLPAALRQMLADSRFKDSLSVAIEIEGDQALTPAEEQGLFWIAQEALNNILKHAQTSQAQMRLHLVTPFWMEIKDHGQGFELQQARGSGRVGLASIGERAAEIGWALQVQTAPGAGTCIRVEKAG